MSAYVMSCNWCGGQPAESREKHAMRVLCEECDTKPPRIVDPGAWARTDDENPARLEKVDGRYSAHDRRYGARQHDFASLLARAELEPPWRVKPLAVDGHLTVLAATGGDGKTWLGFAMAAGVAHGSRVAGMETVQGRALLPTPRMAHGCSARG